MGRTIAIIVEQKKSVSYLIRKITRKQTNKIKATQKIQTFYKPHPISRLL